jgi:hypothetical protein
VEIQEIRSPKDNHRMYLRATAITFGVLLLLATAACGNGKTYTTTKGDDQYDLSAMALRAGDVPKGLEEVEIEDHTFDNERWAGLFGQDDPENKQKQLEAQGRLKGYVTAFSTGQLAKVLAVTSISTLYTDEAAAKESALKYACGVPLDDTTPTTSFVVPKLGDGASGFLAEETQGQGQTVMQTTLCIRTGRILHAIQQTSIPGTEDVALSVRLAQRMLGHVNDAFDGKATPTPADASTGTAAPDKSPTPAK